MRMRSVTSFLNIMTLCCLLVVSAGCAQTKATLKEGSLTGGAATTLKTLTVANDGSVLEITADRPFTYTFYHASQPDRTIVDLAQTEPGSLAGEREINKGSLKSVKVSRHDLTGGFLTRIEIFQKNNVELEVTTDPADKGKLLVFEVANSAPAGVAAPEKAHVSQPQAKAEVKETATATAGNGKEAAVENKQGPAPAVVAKNEVKQKQAQPAPEHKGPEAVASRLLTGINSDKDGVAINVSGGVDKIDSFKLSQPDRLVVDLFGVKSAMSAQSVPIDSHGIGTARIGLSPDKVRVVLDAKNHLPPYDVLKVSAGVQVLIPEEPAASAKTAREPVKAAGLTPVVPAVRHGAPAVEAIDFKLMDGYSRIAVKVSDGCSIGKPARVAEGLSLTIGNCRIPKKLQRMLDTSAFPSTITGVTPYQVRSKGRYSAKILVRMRSPMPYKFSTKDNEIYWDIKNPEPAEVSPQAAEIEKKELTAAPSEDKAAKEESVITKPGTEKKYTGRRVTLEFSDADVRKIFQLIAEVSNLNFLVGDDVTGTITLKLVNVPWDQALDVILDSKNLEMRREGNIVEIKPAGKFKSIAQEEMEAKKARESAMDLQTAIFNINYASVADIAAQLKSMQTPREGVSISQDLRTNKVIVTDIAPAIERMRALVKSLDIPEKQVMIEARIVEATSTFTRDMGIQWGVHYLDGSASLLGINQLDTGFGGYVTPPPTSGSSGPGAALGMSFGKLTSNVQLDMRLSAAATNGEIKIISTPKVVTLNNKAAKISQGQSIPYQTTSAEGTKTEFVEAALTLEVTPHVTSDGSIFMKIKASNDSAGTGTPPPINKKEATTELSVKNGETTVIGGIYVDSDTSEDQGVPFLQDIPLLGWLFKSNTKQKTKTELLIFITPRIVS